MPFFPAITALSDENHLTSHWQTTLLPFWQQLQHAEFCGVSGVRISYSYYRTPGATSAWVISSGRIESAIKYVEVLYELQQAGYSVFILDHRGQGQSERMLADRQLGYVADFKDYQQDLVTFLQDIVVPSGHQQHLLLAHSMGAAIATALLTLPEWQNWHKFFHAAVLCSPMFGIYSSVVPTYLAEHTAAAYCKLADWLTAQQPRYFLGQNQYTNKPFLDNELTGSHARYQAFRSCYQSEPRLQLGGVSCHWLYQAIIAMRALRKHVHNCQTPVLMLQAQADRVVANNAQQYWFERLPNNLVKQRLMLSAAKHELLMEQDHIRHECLDAINHFLKEI